MPVDESLPRSTDDIGQLQEWPGHLPGLRRSFWLRCGLQRKRIQRAGGRSEMHLGHVQVAAGGFQIRMAEQKLNGAQICARFKEMGGKAVAQRMRMDMLLQAGALCSVFDFVEDALGAP